MSQTTQADTQPSEVDPQAQMAFLERKLLEGTNLMIRMHDHMVKQDEVLVQITSEYEGKDEVLENLYDQVLVLTRALGDAHKRIDELTAQ